MFERKAIVVSGNKINSLDNENTTMVIFDLDDNKVVGVETIVLNNIFPCHINIF